MIPKARPYLLYKGETIRPVKDPPVHIHIEPGVFEYLDHIRDHVLREFRRENDRRDPPA